MIFVRDIDALMACYSQKCQGEVQEFVEQWKTDPYGKRPVKDARYCIRYVCNVCNEVLKPANVMVDEYMTKQIRVVLAEFD